MDFELWIARGALVVGGGWRVADGEMGSKIRSGAYKHHDQLQYSGNTPLL